MCCLRILLMAKVDFRWTNDHGKREESYRQENSFYFKKNLSLCHFVDHNSHKDLCWYWSWAYTVRGQRITVWVVAPNFVMLFYLVIKLVI